MAQGITGIGVQEALTLTPEGEQSKIIGSSYYRGEHCNFNPHVAEFAGPEFLRHFLLKGWTPSGRFIGKDTRITAFGSCFAGNITAHLSAIGFSLSRQRNPNIYISSMGDGLVNVHALAQQFEWALENVTPPEGLWQGFRREEFGYDENVRELTRQAFLNTDFFILTMGLSEVWYDEVTGGVFWRAIPMDKFDKTRHKFRVCSFAETKQQIERIYELVRRHVPRAKILFTLSPIPLTATFRPISAITANSPSKALLRAALDEFLREHWDDVNKTLFYFPSYEIANDLFVARYHDDNRHVRQEIVDFIMLLFEATYCDTALSFDEVAVRYRQERITSLHYAARQVAQTATLPNQPEEGSNVRRASNGQAQISNSSSAAAKDAGKGPSVSSRTSVVSSGSRFALEAPEAFRSTASVFVNYARYLPPALADSQSFRALKAAAEGNGLGSAQEQHVAICAFLDCLKRASQHGTADPPAYLFVAKCGEFDGYLDQKAVEYQANARTDWSSQAVKSDNNAVLAQVVDEIATHMRGFSEPSMLYASLVGYTKARIAAVLPAVINDMRQEANIALVLPFLEKTLSVPGDVAEFGCFRGVLSVKLAWFLKAVGAKKHYYAFDTFHGFEIDDPAGGALGIGAFRDDEFNAFSFLTKWSHVLPLTPIKGDATKTCAQLKDPLSFVWLDLDMGVLMDPVLRQIWPLCGPDTIIGVDDVTRPDTPTVAPWLDELIAAGALELIFNSDESAPYTCIRFLKKKGPYPTEPMGRRPPRPAG